MTKKRYYAKPDTWFKEGTEAFREEEMWPEGSLTDSETGEKSGSAIYRGTYVIGEDHVIHFGFRKDINLATKYL